MYRTEQKHKRKRIFPVACIVVLCALLFTGCVEYRTYYSDVDAVRFYANIKQDAKSDSGRKAAVYDGRVYYLSAENGTQGVYSMKAGGGDVRLEFAAEDIRALAVKSDGIYYAGYVQTVTDSDGYNRIFHLFYRASGTSSATDLMKETSEKSAYEQYTVWDFFVSPDGTILLDVMANQSINLSAVQVDALIIIADEEPVAYDAYTKTGEFILCEKGTATQLYQYRDYLTVSQNELLHSGEDEALFGTNHSVLDISAGQLLFGMERLKTRTLAGCKESSGVWLYGLNGDELMLLAERGIIWVNMKTLEQRQLTLFSEDEYVYGCFTGADDLLLLTNRIREFGRMRVRWYDFWGLPYTKSESLVRVCPETGEQAEILNVPGGQEILYVDDMRAAVASGKTVLVYDISGDTPVLTQTIELEHEIVDCANKVDAAGNWLFLYRFNEETGRDELLEKVDIG